MAKGLKKGLTQYGDQDFSRYLRYSFARSMGYSGTMLSRPVVGIAYPPSGFNNCHRHFPELLEAVKRGVISAGGLPLEFPTISLGEAFINPTSMMFRNLMSASIVMLVAGFFGESGAWDLFGDSSTEIWFVIGIAGWGYILYALWAGDVKEASESGSDGVQFAFPTMRGIVSATGATG